MNKPDQKIAQKGRRRTANAEEMDRARITEAAMLRLSSGGLSSISLRSVAADVGCSNQVIYTLFGNKSGLIDSIAQEGFIRLGQTCRSAHRSSSQEESLLSAIRSYRDFAIENERLYTLMFDRQFDYSPSSATKDLAYRSYLALSERSEALFLERQTLRDRFASGLDFSRALWTLLHGHIDIELSSWASDDIGGETTLLKSVRGLIN